MHPNTSQGYAHIIRTSGSNPFIAYAVNNDGAKPANAAATGLSSPARRNRWAKARSLPGSRQSRDPSLTVGLLNGSEVQLSIF